jgi:hypothetical protein
MAVTFFLSLADGATSSDGAATEEYFPNTAEAGAVFEHAQRSSRGVLFSGPRAA